MKIRDSRPVPFEKSDSAIWTDPHIQRNLLAAHLDPASDGATRSSRSVEATLDFICSNSTPGSHLLDLGCGPGIYTSALKERGYRVTGIDFNKASIEYAAAGRKDIEYIYGDYITDYPRGKFGTVIMIYCDLGTYGDGDRDALLRNVYRSLDDRGVFIFDLFTEGITDEKAESADWEYAPRGGFWSEGEYLLLSRTYHYPRQMAFGYRHHLLTGGESKDFILWDRYYSEQGITDALEATGFSKVEITRGLLKGNNFTSNSQMFVVATK